MTADEPRKLPARDRREEEPRQIYLASAARRRRRRRRSSGRAALLLGLCLALLVLFTLWLAFASDGREQDPAQVAGVVRVVVGERVLVERPAQQVKLLEGDPLRRWLAGVPDARRERRGIARVKLLTDRAALMRRVRRAAALGGGIVELPQRVVSSQATLPVVKQRLRNNCETAALSMLLAARGIRVDQLVLQRQIERSGTLDPRTAPNGTMIWGDPERGYVGRAEGGGVAGGFGVYEGPVKALAERRGARLRDLSRRPPAAIYRRLQEGRPVMVWVGLSDGPYKTWRSPQGRSVTGNFGEHTVVLTGIQGDTLRLNDPLAGARTTWTKADFELMWERLGRRALSV